MKFLSFPIIYAVYQSTFLYVSLNLFIFCLNVQFVASLTNMFKIKNIYGMKSELTLCSEKLYCQIRL